MKKSQTKTAFARRLRREQTDAERALWTRLRNRQLQGVRFRRQQPIGTYVVDFVSLEKRIIIDIDGGQHDKEVTRRSDEARTRWLRERQYEVLRFWNDEVLNNLEGALEAIAVAVGEESLSSPSP